MFYSFFATCTKSNIDPQKWLTYVIEIINDTKNSQLKYLLPQFIDKNLLKKDRLAGLHAFKRLLRMARIANPHQLGYIRDYKTQQAYK
jgi:hypothetical protein